MDSMSLFDSNPNSFPTFLDYSECQPGVAFDLDRISYPRENLTRMPNRIRVTLVDL